MRKGILQKMFNLNEKLGVMKGYQYSFSYATNLKTGIALKKTKLWDDIKIQCQVILT